MWSRFPPPSSLPFTFLSSSLSQPNFPSVWDLFMTLYHWLILILFFLSNYFIFVFFIYLLLFTRFWRLKKRRHSSQSKSWRLRYCDYTNSWKRRKALTLLSRLEQGVVVLNQDPLWAMCGAFWPQVNSLLISFLPLLLSSPLVLSLFVPNQSSYLILLLLSQRLFCEGCTRADACISIILHGPQEIREVSRWSPASVVVQNAA